MNTSRRWLTGLTVVGLLAALTVGLAALLNRGAATEQTPPGGLAAPEQQAPTPTLQSAIVFGGNDATWTPFPTFTPWPTPTRRPGPTSTALPLPIPANDASGEIRYAIWDEDSLSVTHFSLKTDKEGVAQEAAEAVVLPAQLGFLPVEIHTSPNQRFVVYLQGVEPGGRPYIFNTETGELQSLFDDYSGGRFFGWHPDGQRFLFWIDSVGFWLIDAETLDTVTLTYPQGSMQGAAMSPDGLTVAYIAEDRPVIGALWFVSSAGSDATPVFDAGSASYLYSSAWSPDNMRLIHLGSCSQDTVKGDSYVGPLCLYDRKTNQFQPLSLPFTGYAPVWSPDGQYVAVTGLAQDEQHCKEKSDEQSEREKCMYQARMIYLLDIKSGQALPLTSGIAPVWSPDGALLAFLSNRTGSPEVWTIRIADRFTRQMTDDGKSKAPHLLEWLPEVTS